MVTILFIAGFFLTIVFIRKKKEIEKYNQKRGFRYFIYKYSLDFLIPLVIIISLYFLLYLFIAILITLDSPTIKFLIKTEEFLEKLRSIFNIFKINAIEALFILLIIYLLGFLRYPAEKSKKLFGLFDKYQSLIRRVYIVLILLCSFTFFGAQIGEPSNKLNLRIKTVRNGYADLCKDVQDTIAEEVAIDIYSKVKDRFPQYYQDALVLPTKIEQETDSLRGFYNAVQSKSGIKDKNVEDLLAKISLRSKIISDLKSDIQIPEDIQSKRIYFVDPNPPQIDYKKIKVAKESIQKYRNRLHSRAIDLFQMEGGKKITTQIPKVFTGEIKNVLFRQFTTHYPILEPVIDVFFKSLDKEIETKVEKAVGQITTASINNPQTVEEVFNKEVDKIVNQKTIKISKWNSDNAYRTSIQLKNELLNITKTRASLFYSLNPKELNVTLNGNLSVDINWSSIPEAKSYRVYWTNDINGTINKKNSIKTESTSIEVWPDEFPTYYRVSAVRGSLESKPSKLVKAGLLSSQGGSRCELCGKPSIGYCHNRNIYVCNTHNLYTSRDGTYWRCP